MIRIYRYWLNPAFIVMISPTSSGGCTIHFSKESCLGPWSIPWSTSQVIAAFSAEKRAEGYDQAVLEEVEFAARSMA